MVVLRGRSGQATLDQDLGRHGKKAADQQDLGKTKTQKSIMVTIRPHKEIHGVGRLRNLARNLGLLS